jgi:hypothetical protein
MYGRTTKSIINTRALYNSPNMSFIATIELVIGTCTSALRKKYKKTTSIQSELPGQNHQDSHLAHRCHPHNHNSHRLQRSRLFASNHLDTSMYGEHPSYWARISIPKRGERHGFCRALPRMEVQRQGVARDTLSRPKF